MGMSSGQHHQLRSTWTTTNTAASRPRWAPHAHIDLQVLSGAGQAQGVKAAVAGQAAVQPGGALSVGQPEGIACRAGSARGSEQAGAGAAARPGQKAGLQPCFRGCELPDAVAWEQGGPRALPSELYLGEIRPGETARALHSPRKRPHQSTDGSPRRRSAQCRCRGRGPPSSRRAWGPAWQRAWRRAWRPSWRRCPCP